MFKRKIKILICIFILLFFIIYINKITLQVPININRSIKKREGLDDIWYSSNDFKKHKSIVLDDLHGYVLPHASTKYTGSIISHTLRFKPRKFFNKVLIAYLPSSAEPNVQNKYYHEFYVPYHSIKYYIDNVWNINHNVEYIDYNVFDNMNLYYDEHTLLIISADFSHFLPFNEAIHKENKAAHAVVHRDIYKNYNYIDIIDDKRTFYKVFEVLPPEYSFQWVGRTRSPGKSGVGYLSFLIREEANPYRDIPNGIFITAYDEQMNQRECLGEWFDTIKWNTEIEDNLLNKVITLGQTTSRLTGGTNTDIPVTHYTITYLYLDTTNPFIRGWHGTRHNAFYLSDVFLENTFNNGKWITNETAWLPSNTFDMSETIEKLNIKAGSDAESKMRLYSSKQIHRKINYYFTE
tara:strand:- start:131 stop:1351 length:1221 start_codon:yes stop_codon:yes gene_type:complete